MSFELVKKGTTDQFSTGSGNDPVSNEVTLNDTGTPVTIDSDVVNVELFAQDYLYTSISMQLINEETGIDYQLSLDNSNWFNLLSSGSVNDDSAGIIGDLNASGSFLRKDVYVKSVNSNDGTVSIGNHTIPDLQINFTENQ